MADAKPSRPGNNPDYAVRDGGVRPEPNLTKDEFPVRLPNGDVVVRRVMHNGNVQDTAVYATDFPNAKTEEELAPKAAPKKATKE